MDIDRGRQPDDDVDDDVLDQFKKKVISFHFRDNTAPQSTHVDNEVDMHSAEQLTEFSAPKCLGFTLVTLSLIKELRNKRKKNYRKVYGEPVHAYDNLKEFCILIGVSSTEFVLFDHFFFETDNRRRYRVYWYVARPLLSPENNL